jgi:hypothetical protein
VRRPEIELHIDELVLHGFDPRDRHRIGDAVQSELTRLLAERGLRTAQPFDRAVVSAGSVTLPRNAQPRAVGSRVARALFGVLRR